MCFNDYDLPSTATHSIILILWMLLLVASSLGFIASYYDAASFQQIEEYILQQPQLSNTNNHRIFLLYRFSFQPARKIWLLNKKTAVYYRKCIGQHSGVVRGVKQNQTPKQNKINTSDEQSTNYLLPPRPLSLCTIDNMQQMEAEEGKYHNANIFQTYSSIFRFRRVRREHINMKL